MEQNEPKVSVIIPVYKVENYLTQTVDTIIGQTYRNLEIFLIDDGSPDKCGEICDIYEKSDHRIQVIHKENGGLSSARNCGLDSCTGEYIICIDSDDVVAEDYIEYLMNMMLQNNAEIAICGCKNFVDGKQVFFDIQKIPGILLSEEEALYKFLYMNKIRTGVIGKCFKRDLYENIRYPVNKYYEDIATVYYLLTKAEKIVYGNSVKFGYRLRATAQSRQKFTPKEMDCIEMASLVYEDVKLRFPQLEKAAACRYLSAASHIFFMTPKKGAEKYQEECWDIICNLRKTVLFDKEARPKARIMALLSYMGMRITKEIGSRIK